MCPFQEPRLIIKAYIRRKGVRSSTFLRLRLLAFYRLVRLINSGKTQLPLLRSVTRIITCHSIPQLGIKADSSGVTRPTYGGW